MKKRSKGTKGSGGAGLVKRGPDELEFLPSRAESTPLAPATIRAHLVGVHSRVKGAREARGREAHEVGSILNLVYMRHGDAVLGHGSFRQTLLEYFPDAIDEAYGAMMIARWCTAEQAEEHGYWKALYGIRLAKKLGIPDFAALEAHDFGTLPGGERVTFASMSIEEVRDASKPKALESAKGSAKAGRVVVHLRERARELKDRREEYRALGVRIFVSDAAPSVTVTSSGKEGAEAARRFLSELWK